MGVNSVNKEESSISVILPAYNEENTIVDTIREFHSELPQASIFVIDNNSQDKTSLLAKEALDDMSISGAVLFEPYLGKGNAIRHAFRAIDCDIYVVVDADMTYPAKSVHDLIAPVLSGSVDMAVGDRISNGSYYDENQRKLHNTGNILVRKLVNFFFKSNLTDIMSGYRVFSRRFVDNYPILVSGFEIETDLTLHALDKRFRIMEVPISYKDRPHGSRSKLSTFSDGTKVLFTILQILRHYRPLLFFGSISILFGFFSLLSGFPVLEDWVTYRYIYHLPLAVLASSFGLISVMALSLGLILDAVTHQYKMRFEQGLLKEKWIKKQAG